jgi:hypothetical protein
MKLLLLYTTGFYRSYHVDIRTQRNLVLLALKRNTSGGLARYVITRPSTGTSPFELDHDELHTKYRMISDDSLDSVQAAWTQVSSVIHNTTLCDTALTQQLSNAKLLMHVNYCTYDHMAIRTS